MAAMGIPEGTLPVGWWIGFQVTDADVWEKVKDGTYSMFSIEGKAERVAGHASGGEVGLNGAELSWVGEEGLEYIIPTVPARRQRGIELWKSAGRTLGVLGPDDEISAHASGGVVGKEVSNTIPYFDTDSSSQDSEKTGKETVPTNVVSDKSGVVVQVNLSPQFNISDTNDSDVIRLIKAHIKELADDLGSEIATMLSEAYENTPVTT